MSKTNKKSDRQIVSARHFCFLVAKKYWKNVKQETGVSWRFRSFRQNKIILPKRVETEIDFLGKRLSTMLPEYAGYEIAIQYMNRLPEEYRKQHGIYYTPIHIVEEMLHRVQLKGLDLKKARVIDPSAGGSAFLAPVCRKMRRNDLDDDQALKDIESRLTGFELDPFAAWLSQFLIDCELAFITPDARRPKRLVHNADALTMSDQYFFQYDYVIGNPPYGKIQIEEHLQERYGDILSGAPNLYQLFYKLSFMLVKKSGFVHFITPTSFIGGKYFKKLRSYITERASPVSFGVFESRINIFQGVQQELVVSLFKHSGRNKKAEVYTLTAKNAQEKILDYKKIGAISMNRNNAWVLPRTMEEMALSYCFGKDHETLETVGFRASTGYVVPHRSQVLISNKKYEKSFPLIWSEAIHHGTFLPELAYEKGREKWFTTSGQGGLVQESVLLIKRTSSKEQHRRIHAALVDKSFIDQHGGFYVENHVNILRSSSDACITLDVMLKLLSTRIVDLLFRCISGTVTVSVSELQQIPMPSKKALCIFSKSVNRASVDTIEKAARKAYGVDK